jgi:hypothetical protein
LSLTLKQSIKKLLIKQFRDIKPSTNKVTLFWAMQEARNKRNKFGSATRLNLVIPKRATAG